MQILFIYLETIRKKRIQTLSSIARACSAQQPMQRILTVLAPGVAVVAGIGRPIVQPLVGHAS
jgi:hypothetical protein